MFRGPRDYSKIDLKQFGGHKDEVCTIDYLQIMHHFLFLDSIEKKFKKNLSKVLNTFEKSKCSILNNISGL